MQEVLAIALQSMHNDAMRLERIGTNLANVQTPGYKREVLGLPPSFAALVETGSARPLRAGAQPAGAPLVLMDHRPGPLRLTGQKLDVALAGAGHFEVLTPDGPAYTRLGSFQLDARGRLVTPQGYPVLGQGGEITLSGSQVTIDAAGRIFEAASPARPVAQLKIVQFEQPAAARRLGEGLLADGGGGVRLLEASALQVRQGALENSNVSSMQEMVHLVQTMRHFESMQKVALGYDEMVGTAIRRLGDLS